MMESRYEILPGLKGIFDRLDMELKSKNHYAASQLYCALIFRYRKYKKYEQLEKILFDAIIYFLDNDEMLLGSDMAKAWIESVNEMHCEINDEWMTKVENILAKIPSNTDVDESFIKPVLAWCTNNKTNDKLPTLHTRLGKVYWSKKDYLKARKHFLRSDDLISCGSMLVEMQQADFVEMPEDLFVAQEVFELLLEKRVGDALAVFDTYTKLHPKIGEQLCSYHLLNFVEALIHAIESGNEQNFNEVNKKFQPKSSQINSLFSMYIDRFRELYFTEKETNSAMDGPTAATGRAFSLKAKMSNIIQSPLPPPSQP